MFDVGDLPVPTFGHCVLKSGVINWPLKLYVRFYVFLQNPKNTTFYVFELLHTFSRTLAHDVDIYIVRQKKRRHLTLAHNFTKY